MSDQTPLRTTRAAVLKALLDEVRKAYDAARADADAGLTDLHTVLGVTQLEVRLPGCDTPVAQITLKDPAPTYVFDEPAFLAWCQHEHPTEVQQPAPVVRLAYRKALLTRIALDDDGNVIDRETRQPLPFITPAPAGPPSTTLTFKTDGRHEVAKAYRDGRLSIGELLALPTGDDEQPWLRWPTRLCRERG